MAAASTAPATPLWMTETAMRAELIGKTVIGEYRDGATWTLTYLKDGRIDQYLHERQQRIPGRWLFHGTVFCSVPDLPGFWTGCWTVVKASANCYEYFRVPTVANEPVAEASPEGRWYARAWRQGEPSTCTEKPSV